MENPINAKDFWSHFATELRKEYNSNKSFIKYYLDDKQLTRFFTDFLIKLVQFNYKLSCYQKEHWPRVDVSFFDQENEEWGTWAYEIAIEIENNINTWHEEVCKLLIINSGLKILITYYNDKNYIDKELKKFKSVYKSRKYHQVNENWLFIFGPCADGTWDNNDWLAYSFDGESLDDITDGYNIFLNN